jgi:heterotetrameric sarcosine oxidase delta subunit
MLRIPCPWCGLRDQTEFRFSDEAGRHRPARPSEASDGDWAEYLHYRENVKGVHLEYWQHDWGCRQWLVLERDTATHAILSSRAPGQTEPEPAD